MRYEKDRAPVGRARAAVVMEDRADHRVRHSRRDAGALLVSRLVATRRAMSISRTLPDKRPGVDAGWTFLFAFSRARPRATQAER